MEKQNELLTTVVKDNLNASNIIHYRFLLWDDMVNERISNDEYLEQNRILNSK